MNDRHQHRALVLQQRARLRPPAGILRSPHGAQRNAGKLPRIALRSIRATAAAGLRALVAIAATVWFAAPAGAHGFGQRYDLPIPLSFYLGGAAAAIIVSFVIIGLFVREAAGPRMPRRIDFGAFGKLLGSPALALPIKLIAVTAFLVIIIAGFRGDQNPYKNIAPTMVWIIAWVGLAYVSAFVGNVWTLLNPWRTLFGSAQRIAQAITGRRTDLSLHLRYPEALGVWPAFLLLLAVTWVELVYPNPAIPHFIAMLAVAYSILTFTGMLLFGCETWLQRGEVFSLVFGTFARFAPLELHRYPQPRMCLRPFGAGLLETSGVTSSMVAFVLLLLASVLYDGALGTPEWNKLETAVAAHMPVFGDVKFMAVRTAGLVGFWLIFFGTYVAVSAMMSAAAGGRGPLAVARNFALTLVPIAIGYHLAHYFTFLLIQGQYIIPLVSDPFGFGWNLFGTAGYRVDIGIVDARFAWYTAVIAVLLGHIAAVYLGHRKALEVFEARAAALRSQAPLTALMVVYTFVSLSILAEPIVERPAPAQPIAAEFTVPEDAVVPEPGSGRLQPVGAGKVARQKLTYRVLGSAFHDGMRMNAADLLYSYMFAYRWGSAGAADNPSSDALIAAATAAMRAQLVAVRVIGTDTGSKSFRVGDFEFLRELLVVEIYTSVPSLDPEQDAAVAPPWSTLPWHLLALMEEAVARGWAAFSQVEARERGVEWIDLVRSEAMNRRFAALVENFEREGYRPERLATLVTAQDARKRWAALAAFYKERGHFLVTNGPYQLKRWSRDSVTLEAFRDLSYPLGVGSYDAYAVPRRGFITDIERVNDRIRLFGDIELIQKHQRSYDMVRKPLQSIPGDLVKRSAPECRFIVTDDASRVVLAGQIPAAADGTFALDLGSKLPEGRFTLSAQLIVNGNAMNAEIRRFPIDISSRP